MSNFPQQTKEPGQQPLTAANLQALEPTLTGQHEVLGRFVGGSNSLIDRAELQAIFRANDLLGDAANAQFFNALLEQHAAADPVNPAKLAGSSIGPLIGNVDQANDGIVPPDPEYPSGFGRLSSEFDYPLAPFNDSQWLSQATTLSGVGPPFMSAADDIGDSSQPLSPSNVKPDTGKGSTLDTSAGLSAGNAGSMSAAGYRPRCGRASAEFMRGNRMVGQVTQLGLLYAPTQQAAPPVGVLPQGMQGMLGSRGGMVGNLPYGGIGQIPEHSAAQMGHSGQFMPKPQPFISGPINRLIGPLPTSHEASAQAGMQYGVGGMQAGMTSFVGQYPAVGQVGQVHSYPSVGNYQMHPAQQQQASVAYSAGGSIGQMDDRSRQFAYPNGYGMHQRAAEARQLFQQQSGGPPVSHIGATQNLSDSASGRNVGEISQQSLANSLRAKSGTGHNTSGHESPRSSEMSQVLHYLTGWQAPQHRPPDQYYNSYPQQHAPADLAPHQHGGQGPQPSGLLVQQQQQQQPPLQGPSVDVSSGRAPAKLHNSIQSLDTTSMQTFSDPSEDIAAALPSSASMQSRPNSKVRVVCSANGHFIRQASGHYEYEGGDTRLVGISSASSLLSLKEALSRVVTKAGAGSTSASGSPEVMFLKYQLPSEPSVYVDLLDDEDVSLMFDEWADFAVQHKGTSYKLHVYVAWAKELNSEINHGSQTDLMDGTGLSAGSVSDDDVGKQSGKTDEWSLIQMAGRMEIISLHEISLAKFLGSGGYGEVYLGKWHSSEVAIKCLNPSLFFSGSDGTASKAAMADLLREADLLASLRHPNVVWVYGVVLPRMGPDDKGGLSMDDVEPIPITSGANLGRTCSNLRPPAVVTEFMSQGSVKSALARKSEVVVGNMHRVVVAMDAAKGMEYLHQKRIVHFDLKSANLLLGYRDRRAVCKVADFGLSKQKRDTYVSNVTSQRGTLPWIAPEIIKTPHCVNEKVDVYSFGVVMWELWTGKEPYEGLNYHALLHQITLTNGGLRPPVPNGPKWEGNHCPEPAPGWSKLMERCWHELPEERPGFDEIVRELKTMAQALRPPRNRAKAVAAASISSAELDARGIPSGRPKMSATQAQQAFHMPTHTLERKDSSLPVHPPVVQAQQAQQAFAMPTHTISRKGSPNMPTVGEDSDGSGGATAKAQALYAVPAEAAPGAQAADPGMAAGSDDAKPDAPPAGSALQPETSSVVLQPGTPVQAGPAPSNSPRPPLPSAPSDSKLEKDAPEAKAQKEQSEADVDQATQMVQSVSIGESTPDPPQGKEAAKPPISKSAEAGQSAVPKAPDQAAAPAAGQPALNPAHVQQPSPNPFSSAFAYTERMNSAFSSN